MARIIIDATGHSAVAVCRKCGWRTVSDTRAGAWRDALAHTRGCDPTEARYIEQRLRAWERKDA